MIFNGHAGFSSLDDASLSNPVIKALQPLVHVEEDAEMTAVAPRLRPARVTLSLKDGRCATMSRQSHRGDFQEPCAEVEIRKKFRELAALVLTEDGAIAVENAVDRSDQWQNLQQLVALVRQYTRQ